MWSVLSACVHHALANGGPILWAKICFDSISFLILIWSSSIPIFVSNGTGSNWTCAVCAVMQYRTPFDIALSTANVFLKLIWATKIHTHNIHVIQLQTSQDDQILVPLVFRFLEQSIEPTSSAFRARWVHYLSGRPIRSTAVAAEELITLAAQVTVLSILLKDVIFQTAALFLAGCSAAGRPVDWVPYWTVFKEAGFSNIWNALLISWAPKSQVIKGTVDVWCVNKSYKL